MSPENAIPTWPPNTFLGSIPAAVATELIGLRAPRRFEPGQAIFREGEHGTHVVLILSGFVKVTTVVEGFEMLLAIRSPGELVGETASMTDRPRNATVTACGRVVVSVLHQPEFEAAQRRHPELRRGAMTALAAQLEWANRRRTDYAVYPAHIRLARVLVEIAAASGRPTADGVVDIIVPLRQPELAAMIAVSLATLQKAVQELRARGLISTGYRRLAVLDLSALRTLAEIAEPVEPRRIP